MNILIKMNRSIRNILSIKKKIKPFDGKNNPDIFRHNMCILFKDDAMFDSNTENSKTARLGPECYQILTTEKPNLTH